MSTNVTFCPTDTLIKLKSNKQLDDLNEKERQKLVALNHNLKALETVIANEIQILDRYGKQSVEDFNTWIEAYNDPNVTINFCMDEENENFEDMDDPVVIDMKFDISFVQRLPFTVIKEDIHIDKIPGFIDSPCWSFRHFYAHSGMGLSEMLQIDRVEAYYGVILGSEVEDIFR